jgi:hypothetical protein
MLCQSEQIKEGFGRPRHGALHREVQVLSLAAPFLPESRRVARKRQPRPVTSIYEQLQNPLLCPNLIVAIDWSLAKDDFRDGATTTSAG